MYLDAANVCILCSTTYFGCVQCDSTQCSLCDTNYVLAVGGLSCIACSSFSPQCLTCTSTICSSCDSAAGYFLDASNMCASCVSYDLQCSTCDSSNCLTCANGNFLDSLGNCKPCKFYDSKCIECNKVTCITCSAGYTLVQSQCQILNPVCGDGLWINSLEPCDDGNLNNNDGCDSQCKVEQDYQCLITEKLPSGASNCKFTKSITVEILMSEKEASSNKLHIFLNLGPETFKQWTQ